MADNPERTLKEHKGMTDDEQKHEVSVKRDPGMTDVTMPDGRQRATGIEQHWENMHIRNAVTAAMWKR